MSGFHVRVATAQDLPGIAEGFAHACGKPVAVVAPKVQWALGSNPSGASGIVAADGRGRIVAHLGVSHVPMTIEGASVLFGRVYASWVDPALRVSGVHNAFHEIDDAFREAFEGPVIAATFGTFHDADWWTLRRLHEFAPVRTELLLERAPGDPIEAPRGVDVVRFSDLPEALGAADLGAGACCATRSREIVGFRTSGPHASDSVVVAMRGKDPAGFLIVRIRSDRRVIVDLCAPEGDVDAGRALLRAAIGDGSRTVVLPHFSRSPWLLLAQRSGFRVKPVDLPYVVIRPSKTRSEASFLMEHWHWCAADVGFRPLPRMLGDEEVVTAAPIGTLAARDRHV